MRALLLFIPLILSAEPSRIAILIAGARAYTSHEFDPVIRNPDWIADALLSPDEIALLDNHPIGRALSQDFRIAALDPEVSGLARPVLVATRYIDQYWTQAIRDGFRQFVILRAGFDTRGYRFRAIQKGKVFEVDAADTQRLKKQRVETVLGSQPVTYVPWNAKWTAVLDPNQRTFFVWESASMHTPEEEVRVLLRQIAKFPAGSVVAMDFAPRNQVEKVTKDPMSPQARWDASWNEPWVFGVPDEAFFASFGFDAQDVLDTNSPEAVKRYLTRRDGSTFGPPPNAPGTGFEEHHRRILVKLVVN